MTNHKTPVTNPQLPIPSPQSLITGNRHQDERGIITYNNDFDASQIKRIYTIENASIDFVRGWQGHKIEQRWFACMKGGFKIKVKRFKGESLKEKGESVKEKGEREKDFLSLDTQEYILDDRQLTYLHVPAGHVTAIQALEEGSKLLVLADYGIGEIEDEYRFEYR